MRLDTFGAILKSALVAGLGAGLLVAAVQFFWTEPVVDQAIVQEAQLHGADTAHGQEPAPVVDRPTQKKGLFLGYTIYGLAWGLLFGAAYTMAQGRLPLRGRFGRGLLLAGGAFWAVSLLPFLKYPANPPGVGDPRTIDFRQQTYLGIVAGGVAVVVLGLALHRVLLARRRTAAAIAAPLAWLVLASAALYFAFPADTDPIRVPMGLVMNFRLHSLAGLALFWLALGMAFGPILAWLTGAPERPMIASCA